MDEARPKIDQFTTKSQSTGLVPRAPFYISKSDSIINLLLASILYLSWKSN